MTEAQPKPAHLEDGVYDVGGEVVLEPVGAVGLGLDLRQEGARHPHLLQGQGQGARGSGGQGGSQVGVRCSGRATCLTPACCLTYSAAWLVQNSSAVMIWVITWPGRGSEG